MRRVAPVVVVTTNEAVAALKAEVAKLHAINNELKMENACLLDFIVSSSETCSSHVVKALCSKVGELAHTVKVSEDEHASLQRRIAKLQRKVITRDEDLDVHSRWIEGLRHMVLKNSERCRKLTEQLNLCDTERIAQMEAGITALQESNALKDIELGKLRREITSFKEMNLDKLKGDITRLKEHFTCSITQDIMRKPCALTTGQLYDYEGIVGWLSMTPRCPNTNLHLPPGNLFPTTIPSLIEVCAIVAQM